MHSHLRGCDRFRRAEGTDEYPVAAMLEVDNMLESYQRLSQWQN